MRNFKFIPFPALWTERFLLRKVEPSDAEHIFSLRSDQAYADSTGIKRYETLEEASAYVERIEKDIARGEVLLWSIEMKDTKAYVGGICLWNIREDGMQAEIGYDLMSQFRGHGYLQEVIEAVVRYAFEVLKLDRIVAEEVHVDNVRSIKVLEKYGFTLEKTFEASMEDGSIQRRANYSLQNNQSHPQKP